MSVFSSFKVILGVVDKSHLTYCVFALILIFYIPPTVPQLFYISLINIGLGLSILFIAIFSHSIIPHIPMSSLSTSKQSVEETPSHEPECSSPNLNAKVPDEEMDYRSSSDECAMSLVGNGKGTGKHVINDATKVQSFPYPCFIMSYICLRIWKFH